jgi:hypothetical protein
MKAAILSTLVMTLVAAAQLPAHAVQTGSLFCGDRIVSIGDNAGEVMSKCGQPAYAVQHDEKLVDRINHGSRIITTVTVDDWTFNFGPDRFQYRLILKNGMVTDIESLDYGY